MKKFILSAFLTAVLIFSGCSGDVTAEKKPYPSVKMSSQKPSVTEKTSRAVSKPENSVAVSQIEESISDNEYYLRGCIFDVNMNCIMSSVAQQGKIPYRQIGPKYTSLSNILSDQSEGFDTVFEDILRTENPTRYEIGGELVGRSVQLTLNAGMSQKIYERMNKEGIIGSVVVMRSDGSVAAMVSTPSYDLNKLMSDSGYSETLGNTGAFINRTLSSAAPGSTFKIISEVIANQHDIDKMTDEGHITVQSTNLQNNDWEKNKESYPMQTDRLDAFIRSSNVYFAKAFDKIGEKNVKSDMQNYFLLSDSTKINCDFGVLQNSLKIRSRDDLCRSAFGQGNVRISPLYISAVTREGIYGSMAEPFVLKSVIDTATKKPVGEGSMPYNEIACIPEKCRENIKECLRSSGTLRDITLPDGYTLYSKTGTANVGNGLYLYITGGIVHKNDLTAQKKIYTDGYKNFSCQGGYIITMQIQNPQHLGLELASQTTYIYSDIIDIVIKEGE